MRVSDFAGFDDLGSVAYWIIEEESKEKLIGAQCPPFLVAPGFTVMATGPVSRVAPIVLPREKFSTPYLLGDPHFTGNVLRAAGPVKNLPLFGMGAFGTLGFFEVLAPSGLTIAAFRCRPFHVPIDFAVKDVRAGQEVLVQRGAAMEPEGSIRERTRMLRTFRRG